MVQNKQKDGILADPNIPVKIILVKCALSIIFQLSRKLNRTWN